MSSDWLRGKREAQRLTQENVADELGLAVRVYRRWEKCEKQAKKDVPYADLARLLKCNAVELCEHHLRDLKEAGLEEHAEQARSKLDELRRAQYFPPVDPTPIEAALEACAATGLPGGIAQRSGLHTVSAQAASIAKWLSAGDWGALSQQLSSPLDDAIKASGDQGQQQALWWFLRVVMRSAGATDPAVVEGGHFQRSGEDRAWAYRLLVDNAHKLDGMRVVALDQSNPQYRLDDSPESTLSVQFRAITQASDEGRVHELVKAIADRLAYDEPPPPVADPGFNDYCQRLNGALSSCNDSAGHVFALCGPDSLETDEVKSRLRELLGDLRLFDCADPGGESTVLRVNRDKLESWYALRLNNLLAKGLEIPSDNKTEQSTAKTTPEEQTMPKQEAPPAINLQINTTLQNGAGNTSVQAGHDAQVTQQTSTAIPDQIANLIEQLLSETKERKQETKDLRQAALKAQAELEADNKVSTETKGLLQRAFEALPRADALIKTGKNLLELIAKLPGAGS